MKIVGVDVGGTFTDIIMVDTKTGREYIHKVPSTPGRQDKAVVRGILELLENEQVSPESVELVVHGTTVATNAMLERKGASVCLVTTAGLEDVLEIGRQNREDIYEINAKRPQPLVDRNNRIGLKERIDWQGNVITPIEQSELSRVVTEIATRKPQAVAVSFLFSFLHPDHEQKVINELQKTLDCYSVASSDVLPEFREFERTSTTVLEAYLGPLVLGYLDRLDKSIERICEKATLNIMQSNGGTVLCSRTHGQAVGLAISGLAGGVIGGWEVAKRAGVSHALTLDMGGTSCDISAVVNGVVVQPNNEVAGLPLRFPSVDVKTIGAGGGSIAWIDNAGILHVGPQSAGAEPGPAAYAKGGVDATVTDANLVLGRLNPDYFVGGEIKLDANLAHSAIDNIASPLGTSIEEAAAGITRISTSNMVQAIREVTVERGRDPRAFILVPFGGAGPTQAVDIAESLQIDTILIPHYPGITSALGLVFADLRVDLMRSVLLDVHKSNARKVIDSFQSLSLEATERLLKQGAAKDRISLEWRLDMRYQGQSHEITITIPIDLKDIETSTREHFDSEHETQFGYKLPDRAVEWATVRVVGTAPQIESNRLEIPQRKERRSFSVRKVILNDGTGTDAHVFHRSELPTENIPGPAIIEQLDTTTWVAPGWSAEQKPDGLLWLRRDIA